MIDPCSVILITQLFLSSFVILTWKIPKLTKIPTYVRLYLSSWLLQRKNSQRCWQVSFTRNFPFMHPHSPVKFCCSFTLPLSYITSLYCLLSFQTSMSSYIFLLLNLWFSFVFHWKNTNNLPSVPTIISMYLLASVTKILAFFLIARNGLSIFPTKAASLFYLFIF